MSTPYLETPDRDNLRTLSKIIFVVFMIVAIALLFWGIVLSQTILARNDNPRLLEQELRIHRGAILDKNNEVIAVNVGGSGRQQRTYPIPNMGPAVGFYSVLHGTSGAEAGFDVFLRDDPINWWDSTLQNSLHLIQEGNSVQLSLDAKIQSETATALNQQRGAALLLELDQNDPDRVWIRALVSNPSYNPNFLDEEFDVLGNNDDAPLLNRVTQGQYQPGLLLQPLILATAVDQGLINLDDLVMGADQPVQINGVSLQCKSPPPEPASWSDILHHQCPNPMLRLADDLGVRGLETLYASFVLDRDPLLEIDSATTQDEPISDPMLAGIGQDNLSITPLQIGLAMSALVNHGKIPQPQIGVGIQDDEGTWQPWTLESNDQQAISDEVASAILQVLQQENSVYEHNPQVLSGPDETINAWYIGILDEAEIDYVVVVVLEGSKLEGQADIVGRHILSAVRSQEQSDDK